jgi:hypothetical protein
VFLESQPALNPTMHWRIVDAATGLLASGHVRTADLLDIQPWGRSTDGEAVHLDLGADVPVAVTVAS